MQLRLDRIELTKESTIGKLYVDDTFECFTLEDAVRPTKVAGLTAIPQGSYPVLLTWSPHFQRVVPELLRVPNFSGIRIHPGNTAGDTRGCILVGAGAGADVIYDSRAAYARLFGKLDAAVAAKLPIKIDLGGPVAGSVDLSTPAQDRISDAALAEECFRQTTRFEVVGNYLAAVAKYRSATKNDRDGVWIGPFRLLEAEWEAIADDPELACGEPDITDWRTQCAVFALMAQRALDGLEDELGLRASPIQIYLAQIIGSAQAARSFREPASTIAAILSGLAPDALPGGLSPAAILARHSAVLAERGVPINGEAALAAILRVLTPADAVMSPLVAAAAGGVPDPPRARPTGDDLFREKAPAIMRRLIGDFPLDKVQAAAILGNIGHECAGFKLMQEQRPRSGRGGWGWCQWTGSRRDDFEAWCGARKLDSSSDDANYGFLREELLTTHQRAIVDVLAARTLDEAVVAFEKRFEVAAWDVKYYDRRERYAGIALECFV